MQDSKGLLVCRGCFGGTWGRAALRRLLDGKLELNDYARRLAGRDLGTWLPFGKSDEIELILSRTSPTATSTTTRSTASSTSTAPPPEFYVLEGDLDTRLTVEPVTYRAHPA